LPLYEYKCAKCGHRFEKIEHFDASEVKKCPKCGGKAERQLAPSAIQFKGTGWYVTDYAGKGAAAKSGEASSGDGVKAGEKPADKAGESKSSAVEKTDKASAKKKK
jgi:putative FmdB family regulatory protein